MPIYGIVQIKSLKKMPISVMV